MTTTKNEILTNLRPFECPWVLLIVTETEFFRRSKILGFERSFGFGEKRPSTQGGNHRTKF